MSPLLAMGGNQTRMLLKSILARDRTDTVPTFFVNESLRAQIQSATWNPTNLVGRFSWKVVPRSIIVSH